MNEDPESFLQDESLVENLMKMLKDIANSSKVESQGMKKTEEVVKEEDESEEDDLIVTKNYHSGVQRSTKKSVKRAMTTNFVKFTFIRQLEKDPKKRAENRREIEVIANSFRSVGNNEYKLERYKDAIFYYTKGLECISDTPVLYCNRGLCYIKLGQYKRALMDFDFVINKLDKICLRAWLYRAACYWRLNDIKNYEKSIDFANQYNIRERDYIKTFVQRMQTEL